MPVKPMSFRVAPDIRTLIDAYVFKNTHSSMTDVCNAALYQFLTAEEKKQKKYLKRYLSRHLETEVKKS